MEINKEKRLELYLKASEETKTLYESGDKLLRDTADQFGIKDEEKYSQFVFCIGDIILGLYQKDSLGQLLKDRLDFTDDQVTIAIKSLEPILDKIPTSATPTSPNTIIDIPTPPTETTTPLPTSADPQTIKPLRTFAEDVELSRVHGYGSFQSGEVPDDADDTPVHSSNQDDIIKRS